MNIKLANKTKITIQNSQDIYDVMQRILKREQKVDRGREHFWTISLDNALKIVNIELVSMGSFKATIVEPMEVFSIPLQKRAVKLILVHNHPSGNLKPSEADKDITDHMIQVGLIMQVPIVDHLIISESSYFSFKNSGLLEELEKSVKYVPAYKLKQRYEKNKAIEMSKAMKKEGMSLEQIIKITGLSKTDIDNLKE